MHRRGIGQCSRVTRNSNDPRCGFGSGPRTAPNVLPAPSVGSLRVLSCPRKSSSSGIPGSVLATSLPTSLPSPLPLLPSEMPSPLSSWNISDTARGVGNRTVTFGLPLRFNTCGRFPTVASALFIFRRDSPEAVDFPLRPAPPCATPPPAQTAVPRPARGPLGRPSLQHQLCSAHPRPSRFLRAGESPSSSARGDLACRAVWDSILESFWYFLFIILIIYPTCAKQPRL